MQSSSGSKTWRRARWVGGTLAVLTAIAGPAGAATPSNRPIGASGLVAAVSGSSMEVQNANSGQTTVSWTTTTQFSKTASEAVSTLVPGDCITVTGTVSKKSKTTIAARSINITTATSGDSCTRSSANRPLGGPPAGGFPFGGRNFQGGRGGGFQAGSGTRTSFPGGAGGPSNFRKQLASIAFATGKISKVSGSKVTMSGTLLSPGSFPGRGSTNSKPKAKPKKPTTEKVTITTTSKTTVSTMQSASATDLAVGDCVSAFGPAATNGAVTATSVRITSTGASSCSAGGGFAGGGFPGGGGFGGAPGGNGG